MILTKHFRTRVTERLGASADPDYIGRAIAWAIENQRQDLIEYLGRQDKHGLRVWRFRYPDGRFIRVIINHTANVAVTLFPEDSAKDKWPIPA